jgi:hypothetical protein
MTVERTHKRSTYPLALRYKPGTDLARRSPGLARGRFRDAEEAERIRVLCPNAEQLEVVDVREVGT